MSKLPYNVIVVPGKKTPIYIKKKIIVVERVTLVPGKKTPIYNEIIKSVAYPMAQVSNIIYTIYTSSRSKNTDIFKN